MLKACSRCGRYHDKAYKCFASSFPRGDAEASRLRSSYKWSKKSEDIRERSFYLCEVCKDRGDFSIKEIEVHHIVKVRDNPSLLLDDGNLIALCRDHHREADHGILSVDYLRALADKRDKISEEGASI